MRPGRTTWETVKRDRGRVDSGNLNELLSSAVEQSPAVRAARARYRAALEAISPAGTPPRPMLSYTFLPLPVETRVGPNEHRVALQQKLPSPITLLAEASTARAVANADRAALDRAVLEVGARVKALAAEVHYHQRAQVALTASLQVAEALSALGTRRLGAGQSSLYDVSRARSQLEQLRYDRVRFAELLRESTARLNAVLDRPPAAPLPPLPAWQLSDGELAAEALYDRALTSSPELQRTDHRIRAQMARVTGARGRWFPDLTLGVQLMVNGPASAPVQNSGQEALGVTVGLSLPLWVLADGAAVRQQEALLESMVADKRSQVMALLADVDQALVALRSARRLVRLYDETLVPQAQQALGNATAWEQAGAAPLSDLLEARATLYRFQLSRERAWADAVQAEARLERLLGGPLEAR